MVSKIGVKLTAHVSILHAAKPYEWSLTVLLPVEPNLLCDLAKPKGISTYWEHKPHGREDMNTSD